MKPMIQIAGVLSFEEAKMISDLGATHIGFPFRLPVNKEDTSEEEARDIIKKLPKDLSKVLITYLNTAEEIKELSDFLGTDTVQLHGDIKIEEIIKLNNISPDLEVIKSLVVRDDNRHILLQKLLTFSPVVDYFITDTYDPQTGASGATGKTHDWSISKELVLKSERPVILAGGINPGNVKDSILTVKPAGVDVHTGVENLKGEKEYSLVKDFIDKSLEAFSQINIKTQ